MVIKQIKKFLYQSLSCENYLRILQRSYFLLYKTGFLKSDPQFAWHYFARKLIRKGDVILDIGANLGYYSILFAQWTGPSGKVFSVEPVPVFNKIFWEKAKKYRSIVLSDMEEIIRKCKPTIQVEVNDEKIFPLLNKLGYQVYKLYKNRLIRERQEKQLKGGLYIYPLHTGQCVCGALPDHNCIPGYRDDPTLLSG